MLRSNLWKLLGIGLGGAVLGIGGLVVVVMAVVSQAGAPDRMDKIILSEIGCPSGMLEDLTIARCVMTPENFTALAYATGGIDGFDLLKDSPSPRGIRQAANEVKGDERLAFNLYRIAAVLGDGESQFIVGGLYSRGLGTPENDLEALRWLSESAHNGHRKAQLRLAYMLARGEFLERDVAASAEWLKKAKRTPVVHHVSESSV
jgi:hypothetical protein